MALALLFAAAPAAAGVVTTLADSGAGSLRAQVSAGGAITFAAGLTGTITLTTGTIVVNGASTPSITGPGADKIIVSGANANRIFSVSGTTTVSGLTLTAGNAGAGGQGGAISSTGNLTLDGIAVTSSSAGDAGGGVYNTGTLTIASSLISANTVTDSTCAGGGAIRSEGPGSVLVIRNSTITANSAPSCNGGGVSFNDGSASITASTITANSAGLGGGNVYKGSSAAALTLSTSVISDGTTGGGAPLDPDVHGAFGGGLTSSGYNLVKTRGDAIGFVGSDLADGLDPLLGALGNNGGPTATRLPQPTSPLLERSGAPCQATDQRGFTRPQGISCDIGAVEFREFPLTATIVGSGSVSAGATPAPTIGSISNCTGTCVAYYDGEVQPTVTLTATPGANQTFTGWSGACVGSANPVTTIAMTGARTCVATFVPSTFTVTPGVGSGSGTISPSTPQTVNSGAATSFTLTPAPNWHIFGVGGTCGGSLAGNTYTTNAVTANCTVVANFAIDTHVVTASVAGGNGSISPAGAVAVDHGSSTSFLLTPAANYHVASVGGTCGGSLAGNTYTTGAVTADCTVVASFAIDTHTVTPGVSGGNGTISPSTPQTVNHGATTSFTLTPAANYHIGTVSGTCGGTLAGNVYTTNAVTVDCTVVASFAIDTHTVTPSVSGGNGTISPSTPQTVNHGATTSFTLTPDPNYHVGAITGTCGGTLAGNVYTTNAVTADCTVVASFAIDTHMVTPSVGGGNGTISPSTPQAVNHGATTTFTLAPASSYHIVDVTGTCGGNLAGNVYTTSAITADCTVIANFAIDTHTIGGNVSGLLGSGLVLRLNGANDLPIAANGAFQFASALDDLSAYAVTVAQQPGGPTQVCTVGNGSGVLAGADVTNVAVDCAPPTPHLTVSVTDNRTYVRYGMLLTYLVRVTNDGEGVATGVTVSNASPPQIDAASTTWSCHGAGGGAICQASGSGALNDGGVAIPPGRTLTWVVSAPVRVDAPTGLIDYTVGVGGPSPANATDHDVIVIFRTGMDVPYGGGAEGGAMDESPLACAPAPAEARRFDLTATRVFDMPRTLPASAVDTVLVARGDASTGFRIERLNVDPLPSVRLVAVDRDGSERATAWARTQSGAALALAVVVADDRTLLLLEGDQVSLEIALPDGVAPSIIAQTSPRACDE
ncbi:InlB B-repeat-containing protein [Dokdonella sp.]|uniref:InlB B-repeat-containing protein n=1 Tax=Dokdonella sp. TaxID=2291710 RepID=UPI002F3F729B